MLGAEQSESVAILEAQEQEDIQTEDEERRMNLFLQQILGSMTGFLIAQLIIYVIEKIGKRKKNERIHHHG